MRIAAELKLKSGLLREYREREGITQAEAAARCGLRPGQWGALECLRFSGVGVDNAQKVAELLGVNVHEIMPPELAKKDCSRREVRFLEMIPDLILDYQRCQRDRLVLPDPAEEVEAKMDRDALIAQGLSALTDREAVAIMTRYGLNGERPKTLLEIGRKLGITRERARQVIIEAEHKMMTEVK